MMLRDIVKRLLPASAMLAILLLISVQSGGETYATPSPLLREKLQTCGLPTISSAGQSHQFPLIPSEYHLVAEKGNIAFYMALTNGSIMVVDHRSGFIWSSSAPRDIIAATVGDTLRDQMSSPLIIHYTDKNRTRIQTTTPAKANFRMRTRPLKDGIVVTYELLEIDMELSLEYRILEDDRLQVTLPDNMLFERGEFLVTSIEILPFFGSQGDTTNGYLFYPDGCGALSYFKKAHPSYEWNYQASVYGPNAYPFDLSYATEMIAHFPVFGIKAEDSAMFAIITAGDYDARINCSPSGYILSLNRAGMEFVYRRTFTTRLSRNLAVEMVDRRRIPGDRSILYIFLDGEEADYSGMARAYRKYLIEQGLLRRYISEFDPMPLELRLFMGVEMLTLSGRQMTIMTTFRQAKDIIDRLIRSGVLALDVILIGWGQGGYEGAYPRKLRPDPAFGGSPALIDLARWADEQRSSVRVNIYLEDDYLNAFSGNGGFSPRRDVICEPNGLPLARGDHFLLKPGVALKRCEESYLRDLTNYGIHGIELREFGEVLISDGSRDASPSRGETCTVWEKIMKEIRKAGLLVSVRGGNGWLLHAVQRLSQIAMHSSGYFFEDEEIPFMHMVLHGYLPYSGDAINLRYDQRREFLREIEFGAMPVVELVYGDPAFLRRTKYNSLYCGKFDQWLTSVIEEYGTIVGHLGHTWAQEMVSHSRVREGVYRTSYEDGTDVYVNYNEHPIEIGDLRIGPLDYAVRRAK